MNDRLNWSAVSLSYMDVEDDKKNSCFLSHVDCVCQRRRRKGCGGVKSDGRQKCSAIRSKEVVTHKFVDLVCWGSGKRNTLLHLRPTDQRGR